MRRYCAYIATNPYDTVIYTGVANDIERRMDEHRRKAVSGFTSKYNVVKLVRYEEFPTLEGAAIAAEKRIKRWKREKKSKESVATKSEMTKI